MLEVLHRDPHLVAIHKPAGLLVHRSELDRHETRFAVQLLRDQIGQPVWPVHRLDRGTSGVLLFALDVQTLAACAAQFEEGSVGKEYVAVVRGWPADEGFIDHPLARIRDTAEQRPVSANETPQPAQTRYRSLARCELPLAIDRYPTSRYALLSLTPVTGRRHQLRRHLKHIAHPIVGDATYGKGMHNRAIAALSGERRLMLACTQLRLRHPHEVGELVIDCPPAGDFRRVCEAMDLGRA
ncbi:pseudouridine synthase [Uliginosibacterium sp. H1]|uniref:pseudouridine synthase n=1 Tax=Uliginosibacterium sp. H1 TaxID=3114757 RepID=UPI002E17620F|nr:pseudouridine synthase [Uliginosibacterium sp. H1]